MADFTYNGQGGDAGARAHGFNDFADYQQQLAQRNAGGVGNNSPTLNSGISDPVDTARRIQQFQVQANQPAVQTLQGQIDPLKQRYSDLLTSIKGQQATTENYAQQSTSSDLGRRGLLPQSQEGQQALQNALQPITSQFQNLSAQTGVAENSDIMNIQNAIAQLQAGNPTAAGEQGVGYAQSQAGLQNALQIAQLQNQYRQIPYGGALYNTDTKSTVGGVGGSLTLGGTTTPTPPSNKKPLINIFGSNNQSIPFWSDGKLTL